jgi:type III pantothenate kinase
LFEQNNLIVQHSFEDRNTIAEWLSKTTFHHVIASSVSRDAAIELENIQAKGTKLAMTSFVSLPIKINYSTTATLGVDRIAGACGALEILPNQDRLVIDIGTCINYEFLDHKNVYHGGAISPGVKMRFEAMHTFTARLPLVKTKINPPLTGDSTESCMQSGVLNGVQAELEGIMQRYKEKYPQVGVILCGGDVSLFENRLKQPIFVAPNLVLSGLNRILLHNVNF